MNDKITTRERVLHLLKRAHEYQYLNDGGNHIPCPDGWVPQWALCNIHLVGTTEGKRRFRELRHDPEFASRYVFETKHEDGAWYYRISRRVPKPGQLKIQPAEVRP